MVAKLKPILPKKFNASPQELAKAVEETIDEADKQFARTYRTFKDEHKPTFEKEMEVTDNKIVGSVTTTGEGSSDNPYPFLENGTPVRYAKMTPDFIAKTQPGLISSRAGRGGFAYLDTSEPLPGIEPRGWQAKIKKIQDPRLKKRLNKAMGRYQKKSGHAI